MVFAVANSRIAAEALRPNPKLWGSKKAEPFVMNAQAAIADFAQTKTAHALAGSDIAARLVIGEVVFDQVLAACLTPKKIAGGTAIIEMVELINKHTTDASLGISPATNQQQVEFSIKKLGEEHTVAQGVWQLV